MGLDKIIELTNTLSRVELNLKEEMAILEFVLESLTDGYWDWDIVTNYEYFSPKFKEQLGYVTSLEFPNSPDSWKNICNDDDLSIAYKKVEAHFKGETEEFTQELRLTHKDGHEVKVLCRGRVVKRDVDGAPLRMVGTHQLVKA